MDSQIENAINIASDPASDFNLKLQAVEFVNNLRVDPSCWEACLILFTRTPQTSNVVRIVVLEILCTSIPSLDALALNHVRTKLFEYANREYSGPARNNHERDSHAIQNKLAQAMSYLFVALYAQDWISFFDDILSLGTSGSDSTGLIFYLRVLAAVHDEIADSSVARKPNTSAHTELKDLIRQRDVTKIANSWQPILSDYQSKSPLLVNLTLKVVGQWVSWIEITLVVNQDLMAPLLQIVGDVSIKDEKAEMSRNAIDTLTEIVTKKMAPAPKMELFAFLNLGQLIQQIVDSRPLNALRKTSNYDTDLAETTAKLVNASCSDIIKTLGSDQLGNDTRERATQELQTFLPLALRFLSDEYDEICSTVIPSIAEVLTLLRKSLVSEGPDINHALLVAPILNAVVTKMRYDDACSWADEEEQTDEAEFQDLRKRLENLQLSIAKVDLPLYITAMDKLVGTTFESFRNSNRNADWRDLDLALHEMYLLGDLTSKSGGLYFEGEPTGPAAKSLIGMMTEMIDSDIASVPHPAVQSQFMELCVRYSGYFEAERHGHTVPYVLESFVRFVHSNHLRVRTRSWYLFQRFVRHLRGQLGSVAETVILSVVDLLQIHAELPPKMKEGDDDDSSDTNDIQTSTFTSQLYLFEAVGCIASTSTIPEIKQVEFAELVVKPLFTEIELHLEPAKHSANEQNILQVHHCIQALGTLARGYSDWQPGVNKSTHNQPPAGVSGQFLQVAEVVLVTLESLGRSQKIRTASRFTFSRLFGVLGTEILPQLQRWINGLLPASSHNEEMSNFLRLLGQIIFAFKEKIAEVLDLLYMPLLQKISDGLQKEPAGTDDAIQLGELRKEFLNLILAIFNTNLSTIMVSPRNQMTLDPLLSTCVSFAKDSSDPSITRLAFSVFSKMCSTWGSMGSDLPGFKAFCFETLVPLCWSMPSDPSFDVRAPQFRLVLNEIATLHQTMYGAYHEEFIERTQQVVGSSISESKIDPFIYEVKKMNDRDFRRWFLVCPQSQMRIDMVRNSY
ncbi:MAG: pre-tRNA nuclear export protein [Vezdaea aestivalis]|nr:MAG: pre-tRNA nuclear export protein [Vezdaea aestivalis]